MMGRRLKQGADCLLNLDPGQNAPSRCMQGTCSAYKYHLTICLQWVHGVVRVAPLGELCSSIDQQALQNTILRSAFCESMELCVWHCLVNYAAASISKRCNYIIMISCATLSYCQMTRSWDDVYSFYPLQSPQTDPLIDPVRLICATQPGVSHTGPIHV